MTEAITRPRVAPLVLVSLPVPHFYFKKKKMFDPPASEAIESGFPGGALVSSLGHKRRAHDSNHGHVVSSTRSSCYSARASSQTLVCVRVCVGGVGRGKNAGTTLNNNHYPIKSTTQDRLHPEDTCTMFTPP
ncbi:hypothetical protein C0Q70_03228 [Pomacea canaliculata]|uniref:Uncharacterized protein n=1 Tax=Pomacea canaliculata TaxID=400727 RepID=A0A2T7PS77_POMCA|nr:hypothetical protein C0Q70_03228 [Pomacea canaliculata]